MAEEIRAPVRPVTPSHRAASSLQARQFSTFLAELVLIVAGILIALYIDGWVQDRQDRQREIAYLELLRDDLELIESEVALYVEFERSVLATGKAFLDAIATENPARSDRPLNGMLSEMSIRRTLSIVSAAYEDLTSTGNMPLIRDAELRRQLVRYFANVERSELIVGKNNQQFVDELYVRFLMDAGVTINTDQTVLAVMQQTHSVLLDALGPDFSWPRDDILQQPPRSSSWDDFRRQVTMRMRIAAAGTVIGGRLGESTKELRARIEDELERRASK